MNFGVYYFGFRSIQLDSHALEKILLRPRLSLPDCWGIDETADRRALPNPLARKFSPGR